MNKILRAKDFIELANVVLTDTNIIKMIPNTMALHNKYILNKTELVNDKIYCSYMMFYVANELAFLQKEKYELNILYDIDLLKFIIYYYMKATVNVTDHENNLMELLNSSRDSINSFDFSGEYYNQANNAIDIQSKIYMFVNANK